MKIMDVAEQAFKNGYDKALNDIFEILKNLKDAKYTLYTADKLEKVIKEKLNRR